MASPFDTFMTDILTLLKKDGSSHKNVKASVQKNKIYINDITLPVEEGDIFERKNSAGIIERLIVEHAHYLEDKMAGGCMSHIEIDCSKESSQKKAHHGININVLGDNKGIISSGEYANNVVAIHQVNAEIEKLISALKNTSLENKEEIVSELEEAKKSNNPSFLKKALGKCLSAAADIAAIGSLVTSILQLMK